MNANLHHQQLVCVYILVLCSYAGPESIINASNVDNNISYNTTNDTNKVTIMIQGKKWY